MVNLRDGKIIWDRLKFTDPSFTKKVNKGAYGFTSVDAHYNIMKAHEVFGAHGDGWGWELHSNDVMDGVVVVCISLWYVEEIGMDDSGAVVRARRDCSPVFGTAKLKGTNRNGPFVDDEAPKKALTDALSKAFSYLGFSADVFLGFFDNHKYVESMRSKFKKEKSSE